MVSARVLFYHANCDDDDCAEELVSLRESEEKLKQQQIEATRRENVLVMRLTTKEQEMQECAVSGLEKDQGLLSGIK